MQMAIARANETKLTERDVMTYLMSSADVDEEVAEWAAHRIEKMNAENEKRKNAPKKANPEAEARRTAILDFLRSHPNEFFTRDQIGDSVNLEPIVVTPNCTRLVADGQIQSKKSKVLRNGKKAETTVYAAL